MKGTVERGSWRAEGDRGRIYKRSRDCLRGLGLEDIADVLLKERVVSREKPVTRDKVVKDRVQKAEEFKKKRMA